MANSAATRPQTQNEKLDAVLAKLERRSGGGWAEWTKFLIPSLIAIATVSVGVMQYISTSNQAVRQPFLERQSTLCFSASEHAARLASTVDPEQWKKSWAEFWMLYWGPLAIVEGYNAQQASVFSQVAPSMVTFGKLLDTIGPTPPGTLPAQGLTGPAINISRACQGLVTSWWTPIPPFWLRWFGSK